MLAFQPLEPAYTAGRRLRSLRIHVRDHKLRELPIHDRTLEADYGPFVLSQARRGVDEARRNGPGRARPNRRIAVRVNRAVHAPPGSLLP